MTEKVLRTVRNYEMLFPGDRVLAAVSGGPDSVFLLQVLAGLKRKLKLGEITVCNLDHQLRGKESEEDSSFVKSLTGRMGLRYAHKKADIGKIKSKEISTEETARSVRYKFFSECARKFGSNVIATGHTLDDQAETVIMRLIKGSSLKGIVGVAPVRTHGPYRIIRPLIELEKKEIVACLRAAGAKYRVDSSNSGNLYFRNTVRNEILPFLERYNPRLKRVLFTLADHLREDFDFIEREKLVAGSAAARDGAKGQTIELKDIIVQPKAIQKEILRDMLEKSGGSVKKLSFKHWKDMEALIRRKPKGSSVHLPGGVEIKRTENSLTFTVL